MRMKLYLVLLQLEFVLLDDVLLLQKLLLLSLKLLLPLRTKPQVRGADQRGRVTPSQTASSANAHPET